MTSTTDEIRNLRAALEDILKWADAVVSVHHDPVNREAWREVADRARSGLKTPRASKIVEPANPRALVGDWLGAVNQPAVDHIMHTVNEMLVEVSDRGNFTRDQCKTILIEVVTETPEEQS